MSDFRIYKYAANGDGLYSIPADAEVALVAHQPGGGLNRFPTLWCKVDTDETRLEEYRVVGTGHPIGDDEETVGSTVIGQFVWHVVRGAR